MVVRCRAKHLVAINELKSVKVFSASVQLYFLVAVTFRIMYSPVESFQNDLFH